MEPDSLRNLDLNLLRTLDALLRERHVTRAADQLGLGQPAVSAALGRLRRHFDDDLLQRHGNRFLLTPLAEQLADNVAAALSGVRRVFDAVPRFDPTTSTREFTVVCSDYTSVILGGPLATLIAHRAPQARVRLQAQTIASVDRIEETLNSADGIVLPHGFLDEVPGVDLYTDRWVCIACENNDAIGDRIDFEQLATLPWVDVFHRPTAYTLARRHLQTLGVEPQVAVVTEQFLSVPFLVAGTSRIAVLQEGLARRLGPVAGIRILPTPWETPPITEAFWFKPSMRADPAHTWLRSLISEAGTLINADPAIANAPSVL